MEIIPIEELGRYAALGELSLDGRINRVPNVISASLGATEMELGLICPAVQGSEALFGGNPEILAAPDLVGLVNHFRGEQILSPPVFAAGHETTRTFPDMADVKGMEVARRALEIAAAGGHSILMSGAPGSGKSMLAARLPGLLPDLTPSESLDVTRIYSAAGIVSDDGGPVRRPPFRDPHHSASQPALIGGGAKAKPGEISLAHRGVLFLDELPEFSRQALESLRQPLETGQTTIARAAAHITYPARFQLVAAMNPCKCGYLGDASRECRKAPLCGEDYLNRLSGPLLDRVDLWVSMQPLSPVDMMTAPDGENTAAVKARVAAARSFQHERGQSVRNAEANPDQFELENDARTLLTDAARKLRLSARGFTRLLRVSRTSLILILQGLLASIILPKLSASDTAAAFPEKELHDPPSHEGALKAGHGLTDQSEIVEGAFDFALDLFTFAFELLHLPFGFQIGIVCRLAYAFLDAACHFIGDTLQLVFELTHDVLLFRVYPFPLKRACPSNAAQSFRFHPDARGRILSRSVKNADSADKRRDILISRRGVVRLPS